MFLSYFRLNLPSSYNNLRAHFKLNQKYIFYKRPCTINAPSSPKFIRNLSFKSLSCSLFLKVVCDSREADFILKNNQEFSKSTATATKIDVLTLFSYIFDKPMYLIIGILSAILAAIASVHLPLCIGEVVNLYIDKGHNKEFMNDIYSSLYKGFLWLCVQSVSTFIYIGSLTTIGENLAVKLRISLMEKLIHQNVDYFDSKSAGVIAERKFFNSLKDASYSHIMLGYGIGMFQALANLTSSGLVIGVLVAGGRMISTNDLKTGDLLAFMYATQDLQRYLTNMSILTDTVSRAWLAGLKVCNDLNLPDGTAKVKGGRINLVDCGTISECPCIQFESVSFAYDNSSDQCVLDDICLTIPSGKVVAIVGQSGAGKSTLAALLERFYEPCRGRITIDGVPLTNIPIKELRSNIISFINQDPQLFKATLRDNISCAKPSATEDEIMNAVEIAEARDFVDKLPKGLDTVVGEGSSSEACGLSGGQRQRIAIARTILKQSPLIIMDEATSSLDTKTEANLQSSMEKLFKGRTVLIIAHRLSTIKNADFIIVLDRGKVVEMGTNDLLMGKEGYYSKLVGGQQ